MTYRTKEFPVSVVRSAWTRAGGKCECTRIACRHNSRCAKPLRWELRGSEAEGGWEAHHVNRNGPDILSNCLILCQPCHKNTPSFGR